MAGKQIGIQVVDYDIIHKGRLGTSEVTSNLPFIVECLLL